MNNYILSFANKYFSSMLEKLPQQLQDQFIGSLMVIVNSHRHNKEDEFIQSSLFSFSTVRDTMYKYSKKAQEKFFANPFFAFFMAWFTQSAEGQKFVESKYSEEKGEEYVVKMRNELLELREDAVQKIWAFIERRGGDYTLQVLVRYLD